MNMISRSINQERRRIIFFQNGRKISVHLFTDCRIGQEVFPVFSREDYMDVHF